MQSSDLAGLLDVHYAYGRPEASGKLKQQASDFRVDEILGFEPSGDGQHLLVQIEKINTNTDWVAKQLARFLDIKIRDVSYAGLKDRNAKTTQWFSIDLAGRAEPDWEAFNCAEYRVLVSHAHNKKLRRGSLKGNRFEIIIRQFEGSREELEQRLFLIQQHGVPNYFGSQRFGHGGDNLLQAWRMLQGEIKIKDRNRRSIYLSAARSMIFNQILSQRVADGSWQSILPGEAAILAGSSSYFIVDDDDNSIPERLARWDIHPSAALWGKGQLPCSDRARELELQASANLEGWLEALEQVGLKQERRALRLRVEGMEWQWPKDGDLQLQFELLAGSYATSVIHELIEV